MKRNLICLDEDSQRKRGFIASAGMIGVWMVLCGCCTSGNGDTGIGGLWVSHK